MALWFVLGLMTLAAAFAVLWPLGRAATGRAAGSETAIYRDQLTEVYPMPANNRQGSAAPDRPQAIRRPITLRYGPSVRLTDPPGSISPTPIGELCVQRRPAHTRRRDLARRRRSATVHPL